MTSVLGSGVGDALRLSTFGQAGVDKGLGVGDGNSPIGSGEASGIGMNTTGVSTVENAFQTKPFPILSSLCCAFTYGKQAIPALLRAR
jgi:hypothetical protein